MTSPHLPAGTGNCTVWTPGPVGLGSSSRGLNPPTCWRYEAEHINTSPHSWMKVSCTILSLVSTHVHAFVGCTSYSNNILLFIYPALDSKSQHSSNHLLHSDVNVTLSRSRQDVYHLPKTGTAWSKGWCNQIANTPIYIILSILNSLSYLSNDLLNHSLGSLTAFVTARDSGQSELSARDVCVRYSTLYTLFCHAQTQGLPTVNSLHDCVFTRRWVPILWQANKQTRVLYVTQNYSTCTQSTDLWH